MITLSDNQQQEIKQILQAEINCAHHLLQSLEQEYEALAEHHSSALEEAVQDKLEKIKQFEIVSKRREELLASFDSLNEGSTNLGVNKVMQNRNHYFYDHFKGNKQLTELWNELLNVAEQCRDKNRVNGSIVELASRQSKHALDILRGITPDTSGLYDNTGQTKSFSSKRTLVHV